MRRYLWEPLLWIALAGCAAVVKDNAVQGPIRSAARSADDACIEGDLANIVRFFTQGEAHVRIINVDGVPVDWALARKFCVKPGTHRVGVLAFRGKETALGYADVDLSPGGQYKLTGYVTSRSTAAGPILVQFKDITGHPPRTLREFYLHLTEPTPATSDEKTFRSATGPGSARIAVGRERIEVVYAGETIQTFVDAIDGVRTEGSEEYCVVPGRHTLRLSGYRDFKVMGRVDVNADLEPARKYVLAARLIESSVLFTVTDVTERHKLIVAQARVDARESALKTPFLMTPAGMGVQMTTYTATLLGFEFLLQLLVGSLH